MLSNNEIFKISEISNEINVIYRINAPNTKLFFTYLQEITKNEFDDLIISISKCFNCDYTNILEFYLKFLCLMKMKEIHNQNYIEILVRIIENICSDENINLNIINLNIIDKLKIHIYGIKKKFRYINEDLKEFRNKFIDEYIGEYENYNFLNFMDLIYYVFHENRTKKTFTIELFISRLNDILQIYYNYTDPYYLLKIIIFILLSYNNGDGNFKVKYNKNFFLIITNILNSIIIKKYIENKNIKNSFIPEYLKQIQETNDYLTENKIIIYESD